MTWDEFREEAAQDIADLVRLAESDGKCPVGAASIVARIAFAAMYEEMTSGLGHPPKPETFRDCLCNLVNDFLIKDVNQKEAV
ncbi:MAG TPA: hypothetical protein VFA85_12750 [Terriglobales bacterium]|nr:hypothetical protein [Terriglobales bacterium]